MKDPRVKPAKQWWKRIAELARVDVSDPALQRRGQLLSLYLLLIIAIIIYVLIDNLIYYYFYPSTEYAYYILEEFVLLGIFLFFWRMNQKGWVTSIAYIAITFTIVAAVLSSSAQYLEYLMVLFALPIGISSFIIRPSSSFLFALLTASAYTISSIFGNYWWNYNLTAIVSLFCLAFMTWVISQQLENAIDKNEELLDYLERSNLDIKNAYESTLEGWSRILEYRDKETEGHTERVTELTLRIARAMKFSESELLHVRRGALLHDIGKLGIPDEILFKGTQLTASEMALMQTHVQIAHDILIPIEYLQPSLDIPYCHHEKWNGTGYPRGLRGEEIPLSARIFAIVDVYDALSYDRPYRSAWSKEKVLDYIRSESGTHFDPKVVEIFINLINENRNPSHL